MIVECPGCRSRYDVSGRPPGTRARCRCGTVFELPEPPQQAAMLACPKCGGNVAATNHACEFCGVELLVKACPRCFARMFRGAKHCTQCGTQVVAPASANLDGEAAQRMCPRCPDNALVARLIGDVLLDDCPACMGTFVDANALDRILGERRQTHVQAVLAELAPNAGSPIEAGAPEPDAGMSGTGAVYVKCPDCHNLMNRRMFARRSGVIVDVCRAHGTWFDKDELARVVEFASRGGLDRAEAQTRKEGEEKERQKRASERVAAMQHAREQRPTTAKAGLLGELFQALGGFLIR